MAALSQPLLKFLEGSDCEEGGEKIENERMGRLKIEGGNQYGDQVGDISELFSHMAIHKQEPKKRSEELSLDKYGLWRQEQRTRATRLEKQLKAKWAIEELIEKQLTHFQAHYSRAPVPTRPKDMAQLLMPKSAPAHELAALSWLGDWRPSSILGLLCSLARSSASLSGRVGIEQALSQSIHEIRIEEAVLDEEMAEIQATCVLHLPFGPKKKTRPKGPGLGCVQSEFQKIYRVITKAQNLRFKALEMVMKKVLNQSDTAEFLIAFARIQDSIHQFAVHQKSRKGPVCVPMKALENS